MVAWRSGISVLVFNSICHEFAALTRDRYRVEHSKRNSISACACIIRYLPGTWPV